MTGASVEDPRHPERRPAEAYTVRLPDRRRPIVIIGAGGIVRDAHLPAYRKAGLEVAAICNRTAGRARQLADRFDIPRVYSALGDAVAGAAEDTVWDLAVMPEQYLEAIEMLPDGAAVLIQKPLGNDLAAAEAVAALCRRKRLVAAVNTQLRFAPYVAEARRLIAQDAIGELIDVEIRVSVSTPWELFPNVLGLERLEINAHSVHYLDLVRSFLGDPTDVVAITVPRPGSGVANTRSEMILRYADRPIRVVIATNHDHVYGSRFEESFIKWEGTAGAIRAQMGLLLDYPTGGPDSLDVALRGDPGSGWVPVPFEGSWFPDAFIGSMSALQRYLEGSVSDLPTSIEDGLATMRLVDQAYRSSEGITRRG